MGNFHSLSSGDGKQYSCGINVQFFSKTKLNNLKQMIKTGTVAMNWMVLISSYYG